LRALAIGAAILVGICVTYAAAHLALIEIGREIVLLHKQTEDGEPRTTRLWIVDEGERTWLHHGHPDSFWIRRLEAEPIVEVERGGELRKYRAVPDPGAEPNVHRLLRAKYGVADRLVRFWVGTDVQQGFVTRETCTAVPVRLEPLEDA
jgi:hypothetical protein